MNEAEITLKNNTKAIVHLWHTMARRLRDTIVVKCVKVISAKTRFLSPEVCGHKTVMIKLQ